jgi:predicted DCC family thiol-disulfide oxidoreductase YuxK
MSPVDPLTSESLSRNEPGPENGLPVSTTAVQDPIIFFDGVCRLCNHWIDFVIARDQRRKFRYSPLQGETARDFLGLTNAESLKSVVLLDRTGIYRKTDAVWRMLVRLGAFWKMVGWMLRLVPRPIRNWGYDFIARRRYRWFGEKAACRLPTPAERELFLP